MNALKHDDRTGTHRGGGGGPRSGRLVRGSGKGGNTMAPAIIVPASSGGNLWSHAWGGGIPFTGNPSCLAAYSV